MTFEQIVKTKRESIKTLAAKLGMKQARLESVVREGRGILFNQLCIILGETPEEMRRMMGN